MIINNFKEILTSNEVQMQEEFYKIAMDSVKMIETDQININSAEELINIFLSKSKTIMLQFFGMIFSNLKTDKNSDNSNVIKINGIKYKKLQADKEINILTKYGDLKIVRDYYYSRNRSEGFGIIDNKIEINTKHRMTKSMLEELAYVGQKESCFEEGKNTIKRYLDINVSSKQIQIISEEVGKAIFEEDVKIAEKINNNEVTLNNKKAVESMYIMADGSMLSLRGKSNWKEIKLGLVIRDDKINIKYPNSENMDISEKEYISYLGNKDNFKKVLYATAVKNGFVKGYTKVVCIADGASYLWNMFEELFPGCEKILDNYHFKENVNKFADWIFEDNELGKKSWINKIINLSFENKSDEIVKEIKLTNYEKKSRPSNVPNLYLYVIERKNLIKYGSFLEKGYIIGSGHIESGHKAVLQKRLKQSGMHWSREGAQYIATLRTKYKSNLWHMVIYNINEIIYSKYSA